MRNQIETVRWILYRQDENIIDVFHIVSIVWGDDLSADVDKLHMGKGEVCISVCLLYTSDAADE